MMQDEEHNLADPILAPGTKHEDCPSRVHFSPNTMHRLEKLAQWRINPASVKFPKGTLKFEGGYAEVSRALLGSSIDDPKDQVMESDVGTFKPSNSKSNAEGKNERHNVEGRDQTTKPQTEVAAEGEEQLSDDETSRRWKAVAVKKMKVKTSSEAMQVLSLALRELEFLVKLSHENIVKFEGFVEDMSRNIIWLVFPWEENRTLKDFIASAEWEIPERISLIDDVARGVEYLHSLEPPICHGDLKSINILVNSDCVAVITDFGSARHPAAKDLKEERERVETELQPAPSPEATFCPSTNTITLTCNRYTLRWAAPELLTEDDASPASDIWALGCVAYEVMTNSIPFQDVKDSMVIVRVIRGDLPSLSSDARMLLIQALCTLIGQCWNNDPCKRPTATECRKAIYWMPMIVPNPVRTANAAGLADRSAELLMVLGKMYRQQSNYSEASKYFTEALGIYAGIADKKGEASAMFQLAQIHWLQDEYDRAVTSYTDALEIYTGIGDKLGTAEVLMGLGDVHRLRKEYSQAVKFYSECLQIGTDIGSKRVRADGLLGLADLHRLQSEYHEAVTFYSECLQIRTDMGDMGGRADALWGLAELHMLRKEHSEAVTFYSECLQIQTNIGGRRGKAEALLGLANVHQARNEYSQAMALYSDALIIAIDIGDRYWTAFILRNIAHVHRDQGDHSAALTHYEQAAEIFKKIGNTAEEGDALQRAAIARRSMEQRGASMTFA